MNTKNNEKRWQLPLFALGLAILITSTASAHSGRTDGAGGHTNHSTGEYHYHHGYPAHDHYDMDGDGDVDCPYDFDDDTNHHNSVSDDSGNSVMEEYQAAKQQREEEAATVAKDIEQSNADADESEDSSTRATKWRPNRKSIISVMLAWFAIALLLEFVEFCFTEFKKRR